MFLESQFTSSLESFISIKNHQIVISFSNILILCVRQFREPRHSWICLNTTFKQPSTLCIFLRAVYLIADIKQTPRCRYSRCQVPQSQVRPSSTKAFVWLSRHTCMSSSHLLCQYRQTMRVNLCLPFRAVGLGIKLWSGSFATSLEKPAFTLHE